MCVAGSALSAQPFGDQSTAGNPERIADHLGLKIA
jgi:hypothetical protein